MWKLSGRDNKIRQWAALGEFQNINDAARHVLKLEGHHPQPALFFRVYAHSATNLTLKFYGLEYQSEKAFYLLKRVVQ